MARYTFWVWFLLLVCVWGFGIIYAYQGINQLSAWVWLGSACFFALYFFIPMSQSYKKLQALLLLAAGLLAMAVFSSAEVTEWNGYLLLLLSYLIAEAVYRLPAPYAVMVGGVTGIGLLGTVIAGYSDFPIPFIVLYLFIFGISLVIFHRYSHRLTETSARYEALLHEYRLLKRKSIADEKVIRQQERTQIGREIHDSVGHKLTNLLMQLEVARMEEYDKVKQRLPLLKSLAKESLEETRRAVKALKQEEIGGISAIISLIRKLEAENLMRIEFSVKNRAFSVPLTAEQTAAVYRAVQEALTNVMRHGPIKEATISFASPGESIFRFEVTNPLDQTYTMKEGYGLTAMRGRVEQAGGKLEVLSYPNCFIIRGTFPLHEKGGMTSDSNTVS